MQHLVAEVVVGGMMIVVLPQHHFRVERLHWRRNQAVQHLSQQAHSHTHLHARSHLRTQPPLVKFHLTRRSTIARSRVAKSAL